MPRIAKTPKAGIGTCNETEKQDDIHHEASLIENSVEGTEEDVLISCVKMKLGTFCNEPKLIQALNEVVMDCNHFMFEAYCFANMHVLRLLESGKEIPLIDKCFYYRCIMAIGASNCKKETLGQEFLETVKLFDALRPLGSPKKSLIGYNQVIADLSITMATMANNHLWMNLESRIDKYLKVTFKTLKPKFRKQIITALVKTPKAEIDTVVTNPVAIQIAQSLKTIMNLPSALQSKKHAVLTLPLYLHILKRFEALWAANDNSITDNNASSSTSDKANRKAKKLPKRFSILPLKSNFTISHVPISSMMLFSILKKRLGIKGIEGDGRHSDAREYWSKYFNINAIETQNRLFGNRIVTDGYAVSVLLKRSACTCCSKNTQDCCELKNRLLAGDIVGFKGVDPGITDVVNVASHSSLESLLKSQDPKTLERTNNKDEKVLSYSSALYYEKSKVNTSRRTTSKWNEETKHVTENSPISDTGSLDQFKEYVKYILAHETELLTHRVKYRAPRFLRHTYKDKTIDEICDLIAPRNTNVIVGFGDWKLSNSSPISRKSCGPIEDIKKRLRARENVWLLDIDEYCTSKKCYCCQQDLSNSKAVMTRITIEGKREKTFGKVHKVLHCKPTHAEKKATSGIRCGTTWNRDANASKNILMLTIFEVFGESRPAAFRRTRKKLV